MTKRTLQLLLLSFMLIPAMLTFAQTEILSEDFSDELMPPTGWTADVGTGSLQINDGTHAGGEAPQGYINGWPQAVGTTRLISPVFDVSAYSTLELDIKYSVNGATFGNFSLKVETTSDGGTTWNEVWSVTPTTYIWGASETIPITNGDFGSANFQFSYTYVATDIQAIYHSYFDDFVLRGTEIVPVAYELPFTEDFTEGACPAADWTVTPDGTTHWQLGSGNYAGGTAPEGYFSGWPYEAGTFRMISPVITTSGYESLLLEFKHKCQGANNTDYSFKIETTSDGGTTWNEAFSVTPNGSWPSAIDESIAIENADVGSDNFQFCLSYVSTTTNGVYHYNFDDISLTGTEAPTGYPLPFTEDFTDGVFPPSDWEISPEGTTNWQLGTGNYAGGTAPEGYYYGWPQLNGTTRLISPVITTAGYESLLLEFRHKSQGAGNPDYSWKIETTSDGGTTWNEVFSVTPNGSWPSAIEESIAIENADVGSDNFQFCLSYVSTTTNGVYHYNFDDISLTGTEAPTGYPLPFTEDFTDGVFPPADWEVSPEGTTNWQLGTGNYAGGTAPEGYYYGWPQLAGTTRLLEFRHKSQGAGNPDYSWKIETTSDGGTTWNEVFSVTPNGSWPSAIEESIAIENVDVGSDNFQFCLSYVSTTTNGVYHYNFDDFELKEPAAATYTVTYTVEDSEGNPIEGAEVAMEDYDTMTTDALGQAVFEEIEPGEYTYDVTAVDFGAGAGSVSVTDANVEETVVLDAILYYTATFNVSDGVDPIVGATISINEEELTTDASGLATIDLADGDYPYTVSKEDYFDGTGTVTVAGAAVEESVVLEAMVYYSVTFNVSDGVDPIEGATVSIDDKQQTTNASGQAIISGIIPGDFDYTVFAAGFVPESGSGTIVDADVVVDVTMGAATVHTLPFAEDFAAGQMPPTDWWATPNGYDGWGIKNTNAAGGVAPEGWFTCYLYGTILGTTRLVSPVFNTTGEATLKLDFNHKLQGRSNFDYSLKVETTSDGGATWTEVWSVTPGASIAAENLVLIIENSDVGSETFQYCLTYVSTVNYGAMNWWIDDFALVGVQYYTATFNVVDKNAAPIEGATVSINDEELTTDAGGVATIQLFNGEYPYTVTKEDYFDGTGTVTIADANVEETVVLNVWSGELVTFTVTDGTDPIEGATVSVNDEDLTTDASGVATTYLPNGDYPYTVSKDEYYDNTGSITVVGAAVDESVVLDYIYYYDLTFTVTDGTDPIEGASVSINDEALTTDASGVATITLPNGDYPYAVQNDGYAQSVGTATVADADVQIDIELSTATPIFTEDFTEGVVPPENWDVTPLGTANWVISESTYAGGDSPEGKYYYFPFFQGITRLITPTINTSAYSELELNFSHNLTTGEANNNYSIRVQTTSDGGATWNEVWYVIPGGSFPLTYETITIANEDVGSPNFQFCLAYQSSVDRGIWHYYFDDFVLNGVSSGLDVFDVTYNVTDEEANPIEGAQVTLGAYGTLGTDDLGQVTFTDVAQASYAWTVNAGSGFVVQTGNVIVDADIVLDIEMEAIPPVFPFAEDFSGNTMPPEGWSIVGGGDDNWIVSSSSNAGGTVPEAAFVNTPSFNGTTRLVSPVLPATGITSLMLDFKQSIDDLAGSGYTCKVETTSDGGTTWNEVWSVSPSGNIEAEEISVFIDNVDVGSANFQFAFTFVGNTTQINSWFFDDINIDVVQLADLIHEEFTTGQAFPPAGWDIISGGSANWGKSATSNAGGESSEIYFAWGPPYFEGTSRLVSPTMSTYAYSSLKLEFNHFVWVNGTDDYAYKVETSGDGGQTWNEIYTITPQVDVEAELVSLLIDNEDVGSDLFKLAFTFVGNSHQINYWYLDNFYLTDGAGSEAYPISFAVNDTDGNPLEDALVNLSTYGERHTDASGQATYDNVFPGTYNYTASKYRYETQTADLTVTDEALTVDLEMGSSLDILYETFGGTFPPTQWTIDGNGSNWGRSVMTANAGGVAPEAFFTSSPTVNGTSRLVSPVLATSEFTALFLDFKQAVLDVGGSGYSLKVETTSDGGTTWNEVWSISPTGNIGAQIASTLVETADVGSDNFQIAFTFDGNSVNINKWYIDDVLLSGALGYDAGVLSIDNAELAISGVTFDPVATVKNTGFETVSFDVTYEILDGTAVYSETLTVTDLAPLGEEAVSFPAWTAITGQYAIEVNVDLDGDENPDNDMLSQTLGVASTLVPLKPLYEVFTSSTCGPCVYGNAVIDGVLEDNPGEYSLIKYQVNWPGYGDPYYTEEVGERVSYYGVSGAPDLYINADQNTPTGLTQSIFDEYASTESGLVIDVTEAVMDDDNVISVTAEFSGIINYAEGLTAYIVVVEKLTTGNVGTNGETEFHNVMMKMLPNSSGTTLGAIVPGTPLTISESFDMDETNMETPDDIAVIVIVQKDLDKSVIQSEMVNVNENNINDVGVFAIVSPNSGSNLSNAETVTITLKNYGSAAQSNIDWDILWDGPTDGSESGTFAGPLAGGESVTFDAGTADLSIAGDYIFTACTYLVGDEGPSNDCTSKTVSHEVILISADVGISAIVSPNSGANLSNAETVTLTITNFGTVTQTDIMWDVLWDASSDGSLSGTFASPLAGGESVSFDAGTADLSIVGDYSFTACTYLDGDEDATNDCTDKTVIHTIPTPDEELSLFYQGEPFTPGETITVQGSETASEIVAHMAIQNNYSVAKDILVSKEIISETPGHTNTFCWGLCFPPFVFESPDPITLQAGALNENDFSGDLIPNGVEGTTVMKYTFFEEGNPELEAHFFVEFIAGDQDPWTVTPTGIIHTIQVPGTANPNIFGQTLAVGDWIGVFYTNDDGEQVCGGAAQKSPFGTYVVTAYGDDITTSEKDGFADAEVFSWLMYDVSEGTEYPATATYNATAPNQEFFATLGLSKLTSLNADEFIQNYNFVSGWNSMSSYLTPENADVETMFSPIVDNLSIFRNLTQVYWPEGNFNTIDDFDNQSGYVIHVDETVDFQLLGSGMADDVLELENSGWHFMPVLSECAVSIEDLFGDQLSNVIIIQELIGVNMYWPDMAIYTLSELQPGKAYSMKLSDGVSVEFPACELKTGVQKAERISEINTPWGVLNLTPNVQTTVFLNTAMDDMQAGDVIGAFDTHNQLCGVATITNLTTNTAINLGGNDQTNNGRDGFDEGEAVSFKIYRTATGETFDVDLTYDQMLENTSGNYYQRSFAAVGNAWLKSTGITANSNNSIQMYPNPASEEVTIHVSGSGLDMIKVLVLDLNGRTILEKEFLGHTKLNVSTLDAGVYYVKIFTNNDFNKVEKLIIR